MKKRSKYGNKKVRTAEHTYDSKREKRCHDLLRQFKVKHQFQVKFELQPSFKNPSNTTVRSIYMVIDFVVPMGDKLYVIDVKGFITPMAKIKYKMLEWKLTKMNKNYEVIFPRTDKQVQDLVLKLYDEQKRKEA